MITISTEMVNDHDIGEQWSAKVLCQDFLGHRTHAALLDHYLGLDPKTSSKVRRFSVKDSPPISRTILRLMGARLPLDLARTTDIDLWMSRNFLVQSALSRRALGKDLTREEPVYIHAHSAAGWIDRLDAATPVIVSLDGTVRAETSMRGGGRPYFDRPALAIEEAIFQRANLIISFSEWARSSVINDYGIDPDKVHTIRNAVMPVDDTVQEEEDLLSGIHLPIIGFVGNGWQRKGGDILLEAHQKYLSSQSHLVLVTSEQIETVGLRNVTVLKSVPRAKLLSSVLPRFAVYAHPARVDWSPYAVIEALAVGLPVVASDIGSIPEMVEDGKNGHLLSAPSDWELAESIASILNDEAKAGRMANASRNRFRSRYDADVNYPELVSVLRSYARSGKDR